MIEQKYDMIIRKLTQAEVREVCEKLREIEQRHPKETLLVWVEGLEKKSAEEAAEFIKKIFPRKEAEEAYRGT